MQLNNIGTINDKSDNSYIKINGVNSDKNQIVLFIYSDDIKRILLNSEVLVLNDLINASGNGLNNLNYNIVKAIKGDSYEVVNGDSNWLFRDVMPERNIRVYFPSSLLSKCTNSFEQGIQDKYYQLYLLIQATKNVYLQYVIFTLNNDDIIYFEDLQGKEDFLKTFTSDGLIIQQYTNGNITNIL